MVDFNVKYVEKVFINISDSWSREFTDKNVSFTIEKSNEEWVPNSIWIDVESEEYIGRLIIWSNRNSEILLIKVEGEVEEINRSDLLYEYEDIIRLFYELIKFYE